MSSKEEVATLMAHGDAETKISLLKKAVVGVTKQKQMLEQHNKHLQDQMVAIGNELSCVQEENLALQKRLAVVEGELEAERKRGHFGASVKTKLKGFSSFVTGADGDEDIAGAKRTKRGPGSISLSPEDQEKIVLENESIHIQLFDIKTKYEDEKRNWAETSELQAAECAKMQAEVTELRGLLNTATQSCDRLNVECTRYAALAQFCHHFFVFSWDASKHQPSIVVKPSLATTQEGVLPNEVREELAAGTLKGATTFLRTMMSCVSVFVASLRDSFGPHMKDITLGDIRCYQDRLSTLLETHEIWKSKVLFRVENLEKLFVESMAPTNKMAQLLSEQEILFSNLDGWLAVVCEHARLLIDACVTVVESGVDGSIGGRRALIERTSCSAMETLSSIRGSLEAINLLCRNSSEVLESAVCDSAEWLLVLQRFWWEGCGTSASLKRAGESLGQLLQQLESSATNVPIQAALQFMRKSIVSIAAHARGDAESSNVAHETMDVPRSSFSPLLSSPSLLVDDHLPGATSLQVDNKELVNTLAAVDRAAVCYHTHMNFMLLELGEKQAALLCAKQEVQRLESLNRKQAEDAERVQEALTTQIQLLSEKLVENTTMMDATLTATTTNRRNNSTSWNL